MDLLKENELQDTEYRAVLCDSFGNMFTINWVKTCRAENAREAELYGETVGVVDYRTGLMKCRRVKFSYDEFVRTGVASSRVKDSTRVYYAFRVDAGTIACMKQTMDFRTYRMALSIMLGRINWFEELRLPGASIVEKIAQSVIDTSASADITDVGGLEALPFPTRNAPRPEEQQVAF